MTYKVATIVKSQAGNDTTLAVTVNDKREIHIHIQSASDGSLHGFLLLKLLVIDLLEIDKLQNFLNNKRSYNMIPLSISWV